MKIINKLNEGILSDRISALEEILSYHNAVREINEHDVNNHIHTFYSFSPYSPTHAAYSAYQAGLSVAGIIDHDTVAGIKEFHDASDLLGIASTAGVELRVKFDTFNRRINNPDQNNVMYMVAHAIPEESIASFDVFLKPYRDNREKRNRLIVDKVNRLIASSDIVLDYKRDVQSISKVEEGGTVTERHILFALAQKLLHHFTDMNQLIDYVSQTFEIKVSKKQRALLLSKNNDLLLYDILGVIKSNTSKFFIPATDELPDAKEYVAFAKAHGAIPAYPYLGDVVESVTGDKRAQTFEDAFLEELIIALKEIGVPAIAYMPTRNTEEQIDRIHALAHKYHMIEISGEDINSPRQSFNCSAYQYPKHHHLIDSAWALVAHEKLYKKNPEDGLLGNTYQHMSISERIKFFSSYARKEALK